MQAYSCPMHSNVVSEKPGRCPKCGMKLVDKDSIRKLETHVQNTITWKSYLPLFAVVGLIILTMLVLTFKDISIGNFLLTKSISYFMVGFFVVFAGFKLMDLRGFAQGYSTYDLLAKKWFSYGYIYPFIELFFGLSMIIYPQSFLILLAEFLVMAFSGIGVALKLARHEKFQCACLGTFLKVPLTKVTLIEDFGMAGLAALLFFLR